jgi:arylsulfatase A-like enzyme
MSGGTVTRRDVLKGAGAAVGLGVLAGTAPAASAQERRRPPNIVIVLTDDLGYGDLSSYGSTLIRTPVLDGMARRGMRFTDFYAGQPSCTPSRTALLTGRYAPRANLGVVLQPTDMRGLSKQERTLPEYLKTVGYATGHFGKWHLGNPKLNPEWHPMEHGFDRSFGVPYSNDQKPLSLYDDRQIIEEPPEQAPLTRRFTEQAVAFMRQHADQPFFVYLATTQPHSPIAAERANVSPAGIHGDSVQEIDHYVGVVLDELTALGVREDTCVIFSSDNGPWFVGSTGGLNGRKIETYEGGIRVPFIVEWPGVVAGGATTTSPAMNLDVLPTLLEAIDIEPDPSRPQDGRSLLRVLTTRQRVDRGDIFYFDDTPPNGELNAIRRGEWKLHRRRITGPYFTVREYSTTEELPQLFNLETDLEEGYDLSQRYPRLVEELTARMAEFDAQVRADHAAHYGGS